MSRLSHFEMETRDPEKKIAFYKAVFGWEFTEAMEDYWVFTAGPDEENAITGGVLRSSTKEALRTINTIEVANLDEHLAKVERAGGKVTSPKMDIPDTGVFAYCEDAEGLAFGAIQLSVKE